MITIMSIFSSSSLQAILSKDVLLHLRLPFSVFLLPIYIFAISQVQAISIFEAILIFIILHLFIYPASNAYNSYMDQDEGSIGGVKDPPKAGLNVYYASILFDLTGLFLALLTDWHVFVLLIPYILASKAYSWRGIRLKKRPIAGWLTVALFQGAYTYMLVHMTVSRNFSPEWFQLSNITGMVVSALLIGGLYPLTQLYQIEEDRSRHDVTISSLMGYRGTFLFFILLMTIATGILFWYFLRFFSLLHFWLFLGSIVPVGGFLIYWMIRVWRDPNQANFTNTMTMNTLASACMIICFSLICWFNHWG